MSLSTGLNTTTESIRFNTSGRKNKNTFSLICFLAFTVSRPSARMISDPKFDVIMIIADEKSTTLPRPSVNLPSSNIWRNKLNTWGCAFSISSKMNNRVRASPHRFGQLSPFFVSDVSRRRTNEAPDFTVPADDGVKLFISCLFGEIDRIGFERIFLFLRWLVLNIHEMRLNNASSRVNEVNREISCIQVNKRVQDSSTSL